MDELIVVTHPEPVQLEVRPFETEKQAQGDVALAYYHDGHLLARGFVASEAVKAIHGILSHPVSVALAATEDQSGNIDARFCLVLPVDPDKFPVMDDAGEDDEPAEPWRASLGEAPIFGSSYDEAADDFDEDDDVDDDDDDDVEDDDEDDDGRPRVALLPIGNIVRNARERHHPDDMARDLRDMLVNLMEGKARDAVAKAIDDLLGSI